MPQPPLRRASWIKTPETFYIEDDHLPQLVLYFPSENFPAQLEDPEKWHHLTHQTQGFACSQLHLFARLLPLKPKFQNFFLQLGKEYLESCISSPPNFLDAEKYQKKLQSMRLQANHDYHLLQEGFYPVDISFLKKMTPEPLPNNLDHLRKKDPSRKFQFPAHWQCGILGPNCD